MRLLPNSNNHPQSHVFTSLTYLLFLTCTERAYIVTVHLSHVPRKNWKLCSYGGGGAVTAGCAAPPGRHAPPPSAPHGHRHHHRRGHRHHRRRSRGAAAALPAAPPLRGGGPRPRPPAALLCPSGQRPAGCHRRPPAGRAGGLAGHPTAHITHHSQPAATGRAHIRKAAAREERESQTHQATCTCPLRRQRSHSPLPVSGACWQAPARRQQLLQAPALPLAWPRVGTRRAPRCCHRLLLAPHHGHCSCLYGGASSPSPAANSTQGNV